MYCLKIPEKRTVVVDTNVLLSSFLSRRSNAYAAIEKLGATCTVLRSFETEDELSDVVRRSKFDKYLPLSERLSLLSEFLSGSSTVRILERIRACRDPRDDKFLELAVSGGAELILTGDADLLALHPFRGIAILTPAAYLATFKQT